MACVVNPASRIAMNTEQYIESSDVVFFGKLESIEQINDEQKAYFTVIKAYKGSPEFKVIVINKYASSCSRTFENIGTAYYVFAKNSKLKNNYIIPGTLATFMSLQQAMDLDLKL
tara:strand:+ start:447 stop:791 length:345 start_codon:yes stop_codon:yes gene_type:complete